MMMPCRYTSPSHDVGDAPEHSDRLAIMMPPMIDTHCTDESLISNSRWMLAKVMFVLLRLLEVRKDPKPRMLRSPTSRASTF